MTTALQVRKIRTALDLTQAQLAQLLGVHALTVSKWERDVLFPAPFHESILDAAAIVAMRHQRVTIASTLARYGVARALHELLQAAFS